MAKLIQESLDDTGGDVCETGRRRLSSVWLIKVPQLGKVLLLQ